MSSAAGKRLRIEPGAADHHVVDRPAQRRLLGRARLAIPRLQRAAAGDVFGQLALEERDQLVLVPDQPFAPLLRLDAARILQHALVGAQEIHLRLDVAPRQRLAQEDLVRQRRILLLERDRATLHQRQPEQADLLVGHHAAALLRPVLAAAAVSATDAPPAARSTTARRGRTSCPRPCRRYRGSARRTPSSAAPSPAPSPGNTWNLRSRVLR